MDQTIKFFSLLSCFAADPNVEILHSEDLNIQLAETLGWLKHLVDSNTHLTSTFIWLKHTVVLNIELAQTIAWLKH